MSWKSGSVLMSEIIASLKRAVPDEKLRQEIYEALIPPFEDSDCDTLYECVDEDPAFDLAFKETSHYAGEEEVEELDFEDEE